MPILIDTDEVRPAIEFDEFKEILEEDRPKRVVYDIETGPRPLKELEAIFDWSKVKLPNHPGEFDPRKISYGNAGPEKRREKLARLKSEHLQKLLLYDEACADAKQEAIDTFIDNAQKDAETGQVVSIGYGIVDSKGRIRVYLDINPEDEILMLCRLWGVVRACQRGRLIGFNSNQFDLPFCIRRSWMRSVKHKGINGSQDAVIKELLKPPFVAEPPYYKYPEFFVDILSHWEQGRRGKMFSINLRTLALAFGVKQKFEAVEGKYYWRTLEQDPEAAKKYLYDDIICTYDCAERMNLV